MDLQKVCTIVRCICVLMITSTPQVLSHDYYTAAVYEHSRQGKGSTDSAATVIQANLRHYERATKVASEQGADLILFPEYGLFPPSSNRTEIQKYLEPVPNPKEITVTPCDETELFAERPILYTLSCMAKKNGIVVVANMGSIEKCEGEDGCPDDGELHYNTNVAFEKNGTLTARYYKEYLYYEFSMDLPREEQDPIFNTDFGKFAMFICFDIMFEKMAKISRLEEVDAILFSSLWMNSFPFFTSNQLWQAFAMGNNATLLASNIQMPGHLTTGSGIFRGRIGSVEHTLNPDGISKLIVATLPKRNHDIISSTKITAIFENRTEEFRDNHKDVPEVCSYRILGSSEDIYKDYRCWSEDFSNFTLVKLNKTEDHLEVCSNGMCCELHYVANSMIESFYFGVYNGSHIPYYRYPWAEENCFLARCDAVNGTACFNFPTISKILFHTVSMTANFTTKYTYPSFMSNRMELVPVKNWNFNQKYGRSSIEMISSSGIHLIAATLKGRAYERDPPYSQ